MRFYLFFLFSSLFFSSSLTASLDVATLKHQLSLCADAIMAYGKTILRVANEEVRACGNVALLFPGLQNDSAVPLSYSSVYEYALRRVGESGIPLVIGTMTPIVLSLIFEKLAKTHSRQRPKKWMIAALIGAAVYGAQLRQRPDPGFATHTIVDAPINARLLCVLLVSFALTLGSNLVAEWYHGAPDQSVDASDAKKPLRHRKHGAWALEVAVLNTLAAALAFSLDTACSH